MTSNPGNSYENVNFSRSADVLMQTLDDEAVLLNLSNEHYYGLNELGLKLWELLEKHNSVDQLVETMLQEYEVSREELVQDINELLSDLEENDLIQLIE